MSAPVTFTLREGVTFTHEAAAAVARLEAVWGLVRWNSTYRDYYEQLSMWRAWQAYVNGLGPYPGHSRALHPDASMHCKALAGDTDAWRQSGFIAKAAEYGLIRTAASDPTEQHHFEYQSWRDQHYGEPANLNAVDFDPANTTTIPEEGDEHMRHLYVKDNGGDLWTLVNTATGEIVQTREQGNANSWTEAWGSARVCSIQGFLDGLEGVRLTTSPSKEALARLEAAIAEVRAEVEALEVVEPPKA